MFPKNGKIILKNFISFLILWGDFMGEQIFVEDMCAKEKGLWSFMVLGKILDPPAIICGYFTWVTVSSCINFIGLL